MGTSKRLAGPTALTTSAANILQGGSGSALIADTVKQIHVANKGSVDATFSLYLGATGATAAGTEIAYQKTVKAGTYEDLFFAGMRMTSSDFLVGLASANTTLTITIVGEQNVL